MSILKWLFVDKEQRFWNWFIENSERLLNSDSPTESTINELTNAIQRVNNNLVFEISAKKSEIAEFTISADGNPKLIPAVISLFQKRPKIDRWNFTAFRQRNNTILNLQLNDITIKGEETKFILIPDGDPNKVNLLLFFPNFSENLRNEFGGASYIFMDSIIGEFDVMTKVGFIEVFGFDSDKCENARPINQIVTEFDDYFKSNSKIE